MSLLFKQIVETQLAERDMTLTTGQQEVLDKFLAYFRDPTPGRVFMIRGAAGTGKTFFIQVISDFLKSQSWKTVLMAPTGRAAKVITRRVRRYAATVHREIYGMAEFGGGPPRFVRKDNNHPKKTCYIVDEASMVGDKASRRDNGLLSDLLEFVFDGQPGKKIVLVGDPHQLPPVGSSDSPALSKGYMDQRYGLEAVVGDIDEVMRQRSGSGILELAGQVLEAQAREEEKPLFEPPSHDVEVVEDAYEVMDLYLGNYEEGNLDRVVLITYSNFMATRINEALRVQLFDTEDILVPGELVMVVRNNYAWGSKSFPFIANGEMGLIRKVYYESRETKYGLEWMDVEVEFQDLGENPVEIKCKVVLDLLRTKDPQLNRETLMSLFTARRQEFDELNKTERAKAIRKDPYLNALQIKYGYAITGHKAQGGQWKYAIIAFEPLYKGIQMSDYLRWTYTVFTRAEEKLFLYRFPFFPAE